MAVVPGGRGELKAHQDSIRLARTQLVRDLRDVPGAKLVAYTGSVEETRAVRRWAESQLKPSAQVVTRLRRTCHVTALPAERNAPALVQAWFQGPNPHPDDVPPARLLPDGDVDDAVQGVLAEGAGLCGRRLTYGLEG